jgi:hypothetical protein
MVLRFLVHPRMITLGEGTIYFSRLCLLPKCAQTRNNCFQQFSHHDSQTRGVSLANMINFYHQLIKNYHLPQRVRTISLFKLEMWYGL